MTRALVVFILLLSACFKTLTFSTCDGACPPADAAADQTTVECTLVPDGGVSSDCAASHPDQPMCSSDNTCVQCLSNADCQSVNQSCIQHQCVACTQNSDCSSHLCLAPSCAVGSDVVFVDNGRCDSTPDGSYDHPYCDIGPGIAAGKKYVNVAGSMTEYQQVALTALATETFVMGPGSTAVPTARIHGSSIAFSLAVSSATQDLSLHLSGLEIEDQGSSNGSGVSCYNGSAQKVSMSLFDCAIHDQVSFGVESNCQIGIASSQILTSSVGINTTGGTLSIDRSAINSNTHHAVVVTNTAYTITNSLFFANGLSLNNDQAAIKLDAMSTGVIAFNTIVGNGMQDAGGVNCLGSQTVSDSIVFQNSASSTGTPTTQLSSCGTSNVALGATGTPVFTDPSDYKLDPAAASNLQCCIDKVTDVTGIPNTDHDIYGVHRPLGMGYDIGATEVK